MSIKQLVINPGSTSTKLAVFQDDHQVLEKSIPHPAEELKKFPDLYDQIPYRLEAIRAFLSENDLKPSDFDVIMCRGGMVWGIGMGGFRVNEALAETLRNEEYTS
ncbi:MAG: butyrate kinase, partial [Firmicutes bacterium]|nr:butyrate kinase [Bacillota bacterium]